MSLYVMDFEVITVIIGLIIGIIITLLKWFLPQQKSNLPPSPPRLPILGNLLYLWDAQKFPEMIAKLKKKYGPIFTLWVGSKPLVVLANEKLTRQVFIANGSSSSDRLHYSIVANSSSRNGKGIAFAHATKQQTINRKTGVIALKSLFTNKTAESRHFLNDECSRLIEKFRQSSDNGKVTFYADQLFYETTIRIICGTCLGSSFVEKEENIESVHKFVCLFFSAFRLPTATVLNLVPLAQHLPLFQLNTAKLHRNERDLVLEPEIQRHRELLEDPNYESNCVVDHLLESNNLDKDDLLVTIHDLILAGSETVSTTLNWALLNLVLHPEIQLELHQEVRKNIQSIKNLPFADKSNFPLLQAYFHEVQRWSAAVPQSIAHTTSKDIEIEGYDIPKRTAIISSLVTLSSDDDYWSKPNEFNPKRFIDEEGKFHIPNKSFMPFSIGPRACPGDGLAKRELFYILLYLIYHFEFHPESSDRLPSTAAVEKSTRLPEPYKVTLELRESCEN